MDGGYRIEAPGTGRYIESGDIGVAADSVWGWVTSCDLLDFAVASFQTLTNVPEAP